MNTSLSWRLLVAGWSAAFLILACGTVAPSGAASPSSPHASGNHATVVDVVDGDTVDVLIQGQEYRVRYIGIDSPESGEAGGTQASRYNQSLVMGEQVVLEQDVSNTDRFGRLLRYVWLSDGRMVNAQLIQLGHAEPAVYPPDVKYQDYFAELARE